MDSSMLRTTCSKRDKLVSRRTISNTLSGPEVKKDRKAKNRESAMLSRERKNAKMKALEEQNSKFLNLIWY